MAISDSEKRALLESEAFRRLLAFELEAHQAIVREVRRAERTSLYARVYPEWSSLMQAFLAASNPGYNEQLGFNEVFVRWFAPWLMGRRVLEIGCGTGLGTEKLSRLAGEIIGLDVDSRLLVRARERCPQTEFVESSLSERLPFADGSFDVVYWNDVAEHLHPEDLDNALSEIRRVLRSTGVLCTVTCHVDDGPHDATMAILSPGAQPLGMHIQEFTYSDWNRTLSRHGLIGKQSAVGISVLTKLRMLPLLPYLVTTRAPIAAFEGTILTRRVRALSWALGANSICSIATRAD